MSSITSPTALSGWCERRSAMLLTRPIQLDTVIEEIVTEIRETGLKVDHGPLQPLVVKGAPFALKRAIRNLVINAATHGEGASLSLAQADDGGAILSICDDGPGIPPHLPRSRIRALLSRRSGASTDRAGCRSRARDFARDPRKQWRVGLDRQPAGGWGSCRPCGFRLSLPIEFSPGLHLPVTCC